MKPASYHAATAMHTHDMHCAHMNKRDESGVSAVELAATPDCTHLLCRQVASVNLPVKAFQSDQLKWTVIHPVPNLEGGIVPLRYVSEAPPPDIVDSHPPLTVALRI
ncbi:MAG: hypothetical protein J0G35_07445 [Acidobacteriales bacterium]|nr:hypothetical protein [Terriglobales bacterium]